MKKSRWRVARIICLRFRVVRRSSSITPILIVLRGMPSTSSTLPNISTTKSPSSGPCIFGLTMYSEPAFELTSRDRPLRSCSAAAAVSIASTIPSGTGTCSPSPPSSSPPCPGGAPFCFRVAGIVTASVNMWIPTFRASNTARPGRLRYPPVAAQVQVRSGLSLRITSTPPFCMGTAMSPFISPSQLPYATTLSSASTVHAESSMSQIAVMALSIWMSLTPAACDAPTGCERSISSSR
mmetsp:Transcript_8825/g.29146  ORF Transcript_8825/g.29146 Transcript_8825/m.29146 type:complete len:238 (-) Transcript_8825:860-1573(-)